MQSPRSFPRLLVFVLGVSLALSRGQATWSAEPARLIDLAWDLSAEKLSGWRHKENAQLSLRDDGGKKVLSLQSGFAPFTFAWATRGFAPCSADGVVHVAFRVHGDGSGHSLQACLGTCRPANENRTVYYTNSKQAVKLDFQGWRPMTLDLEQFQTPAGGRRDQDLNHVIFLQFMVIAAEASKKPVDVGVDDIRFFGHTAEELAKIEQQKQERQRTVDAVGPLLAEARRELTALGSQLDAQAKQGKYVDVARVYLAAWRWSADDIQRSLEAEEPAIVHQTLTQVAELRSLLAQPQKLLGRANAQAPAASDPYHAQDNPYFKGVVQVARSMSGKETTYAKGRKGYTAISDAWKFAGFGNTLFDAAWSMTTPGSSLRHHPVLAANVLNLLDLIAHQHTEGDFNVDRMAVHGRDTNINRFCLAPTLDAWWLLRQAYPNLLPPAKQTDLEAGLKQLADYQLTDYGLARVARDAHEKFPAYPNMDVHHILIMTFADRLWGGPQYARERDAFVKILDSAVYPQGAFAYINTQNECFVYHHLNVVYSARFWKLTSNPTTLAMLKRTIPYYPANVEPAGMPEYYTDACWKHYWSGGGPAGPDVIAGLFDDRKNKRVAETCGEIWGYGHGYMSAIAAEFWKPLPSTPLPDGYVMHDTNIAGPHGRYGTWSFAGNGRNYGVGYQGKDTFVGCMITDPPRRPMPLDSALQVVTTEVRLNLKDNHWNGGRCCSALERLTTALGPDFGSLAVRYTVSKPNWHHKNDELLPWEGTQQWYLSKTRLLGLVALEATADETRAAVLGRIRLGMGLTLVPDGAQAWRYGRMRIKLHTHNYAQVTSKPSETFFLDKPESYRSTEITLVDPVSAKATKPGNVPYPQGSRYWFVVEVFPDCSPPAEKVEVIQRGTVVGFAFREQSRRIAVLHNPTDMAAPCDSSLGTSGKVTLYDDITGKGKTSAGQPIVTLGPHRHVTIVGE